MRRRARIAGLIALGLLVTMAATALRSQRVGVLAQVTVRPTALVVVTGADLATLGGVPTAGLAAWAWRDGAFVAVPEQVDERDAAGLFVAREDGVVDANDQVVVAFETRGAQAPAGVRPSELVGGVLLEVRLADPLAAGSDGWLYLGHAASPPTTAPLVRFDAGTDEVRSGAYVLGIADPAVDGFVGIERLSLFSDARDLLDRSKVRLTIAYPTGPEVATEADLAAIAALGIDVGGLTPDPLIVGPVRVVFDAGGTVTAGPAEIAVDLSSLGGIGGGLIEFGALRVSFDLSPEADGAVYRDSNLPAGVPVDGQPDEVPDRPPPSWREVALPVGRIVQVGRPVSGTAAMAYYLDDELSDPEDTGDTMSFGDHGAEGDDPGEFVQAGFPGRLFVLPAGGPSAEEVAAQAAAPVSVEVTVRAGAPTTTPGGPTPTADRATATATRTVPAPTVTPGGGTTLYIPSVARRR